MEDKTNLKEIVRNIQDKKVLLPDFQRGFVWKEEDRQVRLVASVLTKMPLGSILLLKATAREYGCKMIGRTRRLDTNDIDDCEVQMLLDGQQRITVLTNIFSSVIFDGISKSRDLISREGLQRRFFLKIPAYGMSVANDLLGINKLQFPLSNPQKDIPNFLTGQIRDYINVEPFNFSGKQVEYHPYNNNPAEIEHYCVQADIYKIPLFMLIETREGDIDCETTLKNILQKIVSEVVRRMLNVYDSKDNEEKVAYIKSILVDSYFKKISNKLDRNEVSKWLEKQGNALWSERVYSYLQSCIFEMDLHQIIVNQSERERAIDIYENLNLGGVNLSTFELVLARAAKILDDEGKNLSEKMIDYIKEVKKYSSNLIPDILEPKFEEYILENEYSASMDLGVYNTVKNEIHKKYSDAFLNILCLFSNNADYKPEDINIDLIKRRRILELSPEQINNNYLKVCIGLDRALFFLHVRCGIRNINELSYSLMLVLLGYIFTNDQYYEDKKIHKKLEAWYWSAILGGQYDKDQNAMIIIHLTKFLQSIQCRGGMDFAWINEFKEKVFAFEDFSDKSFLLLEKSRVPKDVIRNTICQYYLASGYKDLMPDVNGNYIEIHVFMKEADKLELHHIVPLGDLELPVKVARNNRAHILNSPLNFLFITPFSNKQILSNSIGIYLKHCEEWTVLRLGIRQDQAIDTEEKVKNLLAGRFEMVKADIINHIESLL